MAQDIKQITLGTMADGAADELFAVALGKVLENVQDLNTDFKAKREIVMKFTVTADEERRIGNINISCATKLAGAKGVSVGVYMGQHEGLLVAVETPRQQDIFTTPAGRPKLVAAGEGA